MDRINKYKAIVKEVLLEIAAMSESPEDPNIEIQTIIDDERGHYLLFSVGWNDILREYVPFVHLDVKETGRVWIQHDGTDLKIALWLAEKGIPKKDIVLAFHSPQRRKLMPEFAVQ